MSRTKQQHALLLVPALSLGLLGGAAAEDQASVPALRFDPAQAMELRLMEFRPKLSPDTVLDYRPSLAERVAALPRAQLSGLGDLLATLEAFKQRAADKPGRWRVGPIYLGADQQEYHPSDEELLAAEIGDRIRRVMSAASAGDVRAALEKAGVEDAALDYLRFEFRHADVMGSGRYFYSSAPQATAIKLRP